MRLSICIPTYNFGSFIADTLNSLLTQLAEEVEIVVLDGGSKDNTMAVVTSLAAHHKQLIYHRQDFRGGIDRDIEKVIGFARGKYCWLVSSDDIVMDGAVKFILNAIESDHDIYVCEHMLCDMSMRQLREHPPFKNIRHPRIFELADMKQRGDYFKSARTSEAFFSFLSTPIFKKKTWDDVVVPESIYGGCWIVAGHLLRAISMGVTVNYLQERLLFKRGGNDSFLEHGIVNRLRIGIESFQHVGNSIFGVDSFEAYHVRRVLRVDIPFRTLMFAKLKTVESPAREDIQILNRLIKLQYCDPSVLNTLFRTLYKITPAWLLMAILKLKRYLLK